MSPHPGTPQIASALALALALAAPAARAADAEANHTSLYAGVEVGNTDTQRLLAGASLQWREDWQLDVQVARADFELPDADTSSTAASAALRRDFGSFSGGLGFRLGELQDVSKSTAWNLSGGYSRETLRFSGEVESRHTRLEPTPFIQDLGPGLGTQSGISQCSVDSLGYQVRADLDRPTWLGFLSLKSYDYDDFDCALTLTDTGNGMPVKARGRALGRRLGQLALQPVDGFASRLVPREAMLLDWSAALGVTTPIAGEWIGGAELYHDVEQSGGSAFDTMLAFASRHLSGAWTLELSLGFSDAEDVPDTTFAGIRMSVDL